MTGFRKGGFWAEWQAEILLMAGVLALLILRFPGILQAAVLPNWDAVGHYAALTKMATYLAGGHLTGYLGESYGGLPLFQFYAPLFFALTAGAWLATGKLLSLALVFRLASLLAVFAAVPALYFFVMTFFGRRAARWALALSPLYLFLPKILASFGAGATAAFYIGLVPNALGLALGLAWPAALERWRLAPRSRFWAALAVLLPAALALTHTLSFIFGMVLVALWLAAAVRDSGTLRRVLLSGLAAFGLAAFWLVPMAATSGYAVGEVRLNSLASQLLNLFPFHVWLMQPVAAAEVILLASGLCLAWRRRQRTVIVMYAGLAAMLLAQVPLTALLPGLGVHYYRLVPYLIMLQVAFAATAMSAAWDRWAGAVPRFRAYAVVAVATLIGIAFFGVYANRLDDPEIIGPGTPWNPGQFEAMAEAEQVIDWLAARQDVARVSVEQPTAEILFNLGSQSALPSYLAMRGVPTTGGLYMESAPVYPFLSSAEGQLAGQASVVTEIQKLRRLGPFAKQDLAVQLARLRDFGVNYYVTMTESSKIRMAAMTGLSPVMATPMFAVFRLAGESGLAVTAASRPAAFLSSYGPLRFQDLETALFAGEKTHDFPVVEWRGKVGRRSSEDLDQFGFLIVDARGLSDSDRAALAALAKPVIMLGGRGLAGAPDVPEFAALDVGTHGFADAWPAGWTELWEAMAALREPNSPGAAAPGIEQPDDRTMVVHGRGPILVRFSYFPYWQPDGEARLYRVAPGLMLVYPGADGTARLTYRPDGLAQAAQALSWLALVALVGWLAWPLMRRRR